MLGGKLMFGHQDDQQTLNDQATAVATDPTQQSTKDLVTDNQAAPVVADDDRQSLSTDNVSTKTVDAPVDDLLLASNDAGNNDELLTIKQQALSQLSPIINHLDQTPEEKFRTTMMMIQASDDQSLIKDAYNAAQQMEDEKQKAQALLDIINEINYFTHPVTEN